MAKHVIRSDPFPSQPSTLGKIFSENCSLRGKGWCHCGEMMSFSLSAIVLILLVDWLSSQLIWWRHWWSLGKLRSWIAKVLFAQVKCYHLCSSVGHIWQRLCPLWHTDGSLGFKCLSHDVFMFYKSFFIRYFPPPQCCLSNSKASSRPDIHSQRGPLPTDSLLRWLMLLASCAQLQWHRRETCSQRSSSLKRSGAGAKRHDGRHREGRWSFCLQPV